MRVVLLLILMLFFIALSAQAQEVIIIANNDIAVSSVTKDDVRYLFMGQSLSWPDQTRALPVRLKSGKIHRIFCNDFLNRTPAQYDLSIKMMIYTGKGWLPTVVESDADVVRFVRETKGAIGYINAETRHDGVKVIEIKDTKENSKTTGRMEVQMAGL